MQQRSKWVGICSGVLGLTLALAPLTTASAKTHKPKHHSTKGSNPKAAMCTDVKNEETGSSSVGSSLEKAIASGNFASAKQAMLNAYNADLANVNKALGVLKTAPPNVQAAFKNLLSFEKTFRNDIQNASSEQALIASFATLGKDTQSRHRRHDHRQLVHVGLRRHPGHDDHGGKPSVLTRTPRRCPRHLHSSACRDPTRRARSARWPWRGPGSSTCATAPSSRSRASTPPSCAGGPRRRPTRWGSLWSTSAISERLWLRAIGSGEQMDMAWRSRMFELPEGWGAGEAVAFYRQESARADAVLDQDRLARPALPGRLPPDHLPLGRVPPHRGDGTPRGAHGHHPRAARRARRPLSPPCRLQAPPRPFRVRSLCLQQAVPCLGRPASRQACRGRSNWRSSSSGRRRSKDGHGRPSRRSRDPA